MNVNIQVLLWVLYLVVSLTRSQDCRYASTVPTDGTMLYVYNPNYPNRYVGRNMCIWDISSEDGYKANLNCDNVDLPRMMGRCVDTLVVTGSTQDGTYCTNFEVDSSRSTMRVTFNSVMMSTGGRFLCSVQSVPKGDCDCGFSPKKRIVGGTETGVNEFPFMVGLIDTMQVELFCGATILSQQWLLTAAHCLSKRDVGNIAALVGDHDINTGSDTNSAALYRARRIYLHPGYNDVTYPNDIALIELASRITFNSKVGPVCLPYYRNKELTANDPVTLIGWGRTDVGGANSNVLRKVDVKVANDSFCAATYFDSVNRNLQFCTFDKGKDACLGDSGGPVVMFNSDVNRYYQVGIISYGIGCANSYPGVNTRVFPYLSWIMNTTGGLLTNDNNVKTLELKMDSPIME